jgi:hypothetical protein
MKYINPIYDRTATDITNKTAKAYFNIADWIRIYGNAEICNYVVTWMLGIGITFTTIGEPTITTIPSVTDLNTLLTNIERMRLESGLPAITGLKTLSTTWLSGTSAIAPDYDDVNDWEKNIHLIIYAVARAVEYSVYCGVALVGQIRFYQNCFRQFPNWVQPAASPVRAARMNVSTCGCGLTRQNGYRRY